MSILQSSTLRRYVPFGINTQHSISYSYMRCAVLGLTRRVKRGDISFVQCWLPQKVNLVEFEKLTFIEQFIEGSEIFGAREHRVDIGSGDPKSINLRSEDNSLNEGVQAGCLTYILDT